MRQMASKPEIPHVLSSAKWLGSKIAEARWWPDRSRGSKRVRLAIMEISYTHRFVFIHVYKTGGTSISSALKPFVERPVCVAQNGGSGGSSPASSEPKKIPLHLSAAEAKRMLPDEIFNGFFKFAFVRNSWDWEVSLYHFMLEEQKHFQHELIKGLGSFDRYVEWRIAQPKRLQRDFLADESGALLVNFVGRFTTLDEDFGTICERLGIDAKLPHFRRSSHRPYCEYYDDRTKAMIADRYREDIEMFQFQFDPAG